MPLVRELEALGLPVPAVDVFEVTDNLGYRVIFQLASSDVILLPGNIWVSRGVPEAGFSAFNRHSDSWFHT